MAGRTQVALSVSGHYLIATYRWKKSIPQPAREWKCCPFLQHLNEWYAAQTSKKIRAVNELKASQGRRLPSTVAYGYKKIEGDKEQW